MDALTFQEAADRIRDADGLLFVAGAGMGVDSGLPDFRGNEGFWRAYPALGDSGIDFFSIASPAAFREHPERAWGFYGHRLNLYRRTAPHRGYDILRKWGAERPGGCMAFTTNVDGHFQKAGFEAGRVAECHGSIHHLQCLDACSARIWSAGDFAPQVDDERCLLLGELPRCPDCGGLARPNILMFGDCDWLEHRADAQWRSLESWLGEVERPVVLEAGAGTTVATARHFTETMARRFGAFVLRINPREPGVSGNPRHISLPMGAARALEAIDARL